MARIKTFLRIAKGKRGYTVDASNKPKYDAIQSSGYGSEAFPTVSFAVIFNVPDELFKHAERVAAEINLQPDGQPLETEVRGSVIALQSIVDENGNRIN